MELAEYFEEVTGNYARLLLLLDMARAKANELGETGIVKDLNLSVAQVSTRLEELTNELAARTLIPGME